MIRNLWNKLTGVDRLRARLTAKERQIEIMFESQKRLADLAYERRQALREIIACETPNSNGTVKRMAKIARAAIGNRFAPVDQTADRINAGHSTGGSGTGTTTADPALFAGQPGEFAIGRNVTAKGGSGGVSK